MNPDARDPAPAPTGTVSFLFSDIEGSTRRWEAYGPAMDAALRTHETVLRDAMAAYGGRIFKTVGDGFCVAFSRTDDSLGAAILAQHELAKHDFSAVDGLRVRMAIHCGASLERDGDYFGPTLNRVARLLSAAHGGQIVLSSIAGDLVRELLPRGTSLRDLGSHRLKDLARPERVYQVVVPGLRTDFPRLRSLADGCNNLPSQLTSFVGREREIAEVGEYVREHRLTTLLGAGGVGKTRLAVQLAASLADAFDDGLWFVDLSPLTDPALIAGTIAAVLGIELRSADDETAALANALVAKKMLLVLDNCEHLIDGAARVSAAILRTCRYVRILATSRQLLNIGGEHAYRLPTLNLPDPKIAVTLAPGEALRYDAIALFVERARAVSLSFALTRDIVPIVADVCRRVDGIALAIELAAARIRILQPAQLRDRLEERFRILTGGRRDALPRQQTLRALIDWSYDLLEEEERATFRRVGVFVDGFSLEAVLALMPGNDEIDVFDRLGSLVDKSLLVGDDAGTTMRYRLLESTREYALEKLHESGEHADAAARHLDFFAALAVTASEERRTSGSDKALKALAVELENVRAALRTAFALDRVALGARMAASVHDLWRRAGLSADGIAQLERCAGAIEAGDNALAAALWNGIASLAYYSARPEKALRSAERAVALARGAGDEVELVEALLHRARAAMFRGNHDAGEDDIREAERLCAGETVSLQRAHVVQVRGVLEWWRGRYERAAEAFAELRALYHAFANEEDEITAAGLFAECEHACGRTSNAIAVVEAVLPKFSLLGTMLHANALGNLAGYLSVAGRFADARASARDAVELLAMSDPDTSIITFAIEHFALAVAAEGEVTRAARLLGYADAALVRDDLRRTFTEQTTHDRLLAILAERIDPADLAQITASGASMGRNEAIDDVRT